MLRKLSSGNFCCSSTFLQCRIPNITIMYSSSDDGKKIPNLGTFGLLPQRRITKTFPTGSNFGRHVEVILFLDLTGLAGGDWNAVALAGIPVSVPSRKC